MQIISNSEALTFDDVNLVPADFSEVLSRANVITTELIGKTSFSLPIISSNMTSVFTPKLANKLQALGGRAIVHRFCSIEDNIKLFKASLEHGKPWVSVGASTNEMERAEALVDAGAEVLVLDLAMGNSKVAVDQYNRLTEHFPNCDIIVSDFSLGPQVSAFLSRVKRNPTAFFIGQGCGSACTTRQTTGIGIPVMSAIHSCTTMNPNQNFILNGGIRYPGDFCKAIAAGCKAVVLGRLFAQCQESISDDLTKVYLGGVPKSKIYSGSASQESYQHQGKESVFRAPEGESYTVNVNNTVENLFNTFNGALRSSMSYLNATTLNEYRIRAHFVKVTNAGIKESGAYGKNL